MPVPYKPSDAVSAMHNMPRLMGNNDILPLVESGDVNEDALQSYAGGVLVYPVVILAVYFIAGCASVCCCRSRRQNMLAHTTLRMKRILLGIFGFLVIGCGIVAFSGNNHMAQAVDTFDEAIKSISQLADTANEALSNMSGYFNNCKQSLAEISCGVTSVTDAMQALTSTIDESLDSVDRLNENISNAKQYLKFDVARENERNVYISTISIMALCVMLCSLYIVLTILSAYNLNAGKGSCLNTCTKNSMHTMTVLVAFVLLLLTITAAVTSVISIVLSDVCFDIDNTLLSFTKEASNITDYYLTCKGDPILQNIATSVEDLLAQAQTQLSDLLTGMNTAGCGSSVNTASVSAVSTMLGLVGGEISNFIPLLDCSRINPIYVNLVHKGLCTETQTGVTYIWTSMFFAMLFFTLVMFLRNVAWPVSDLEDRNRPNKINARSTVSAAAFRMESPMGVEPLPRETIMATAFQEQPPTAEVVAVEESEVVIELPPISPGATAI